jgi:3-hydroxybutyryl-CoA dehydrogenase
MTINSICVCGAGTMGSGIAQAAAQAGIYTILFDLNPSVIQKARSGIEKNLDSLVSKQKITDKDKQGIIQRIHFTSELQECLADIIIEAIIEKMEAKLGLFNQLAEINHSECIFASNTSSLSIEKIAAGVQKPERVIGMHFFNPATIMKLVEVVNTHFTNEVTTNTVLELIRLMNKTAVICRDSPGFIVNRVARPFYIETLRLLEQGIVSIEQADHLLEASGFRMGPFKLMDLIGNDINYAVSCSVYEQLNKPDRLKPSYLQEENVKTGKLGKKTGKGFYTYE